MDIEHLKMTAWDERRDLLTPGDYDATLDVCVRHFIACARDAIERKGSFCVVLSGGSTPKAVYAKLSSPPYRQQIDWTKVHLFWGDERPVPPDAPESNYAMTMQAGFATLPIPPHQIHRMEAEKDIEQHALAYEQILRTHLENNTLDLTILGMGEDGHTASLFPQTEGLKAENRLAIANYIPQKETWRMTVTFALINQSEDIVLYVLGDAKKHTLKEVLESPPQFDRYPVQRVGTQEHKALWIIDQAAASLISNRYP